MQYLLLMYLGAAWNQMGLAARQLTKTSVLGRDGKRLVTDGPFAETREQRGGYMLSIVDQEELLCRPTDTTGLSGQGC
jgi:hypothetical protein